MLLAYRCQATDHAIIIPPDVTEDSYTTEQLHGYAGLMRRELSAPPRSLGDAWSPVRQRMYRGAGGIRNNCDKTPAHAFRILYPKDFIRLAVGRENPFQCNDVVHHEVRGPVIKRLPAAGCRGSTGGTCRIPVSVANRRGEIGRRPI